MLFRYDKNKNEILSLEKTTFSAEDLKELQNIEVWIRKNPSMLSESEEEDIMIIGEQKTSITMKRLDLLGVDRFGNIIIIEAKRDLAEAMMEFQAITYTSYFVNTTFNEICKLYKEYLEKNNTELGLSEDLDFLKEAEKQLRNFCSSNITLPEDFNKNQRIILVAGDFSEDLLSAVTWLILKDIDIECIKLEPYKLNEELLIYPRKILPTPDISENIVKIKIAEEEIENKRRKYKQWGGKIEDHYNKLNPLLGRHLEEFIKELDIEPTNLSNSGFHLVNNNKRIMISTYVKSKIEFRFSQGKKEEVEGLLDELGITSFVVKEKADIESYGLENPTPSIDYKEEYGSFKDIKKICKMWLEIGK